VEDVWETGTSLIGDIDEFIAGDVRVRLDLVVRNRDIDFDPNASMVRAWGPGAGIDELVPHGAEIEVLRWRDIVGGVGLPTRHAAEIGRDGKVNIRVARGGSVRGSGLCMHMENDAAMISQGITENEFCDFGVHFDGFRHDTPRRGFLDLAVSNREFNFLSQLTDSSDYTAQVLGMEPKQAEVSVGIAANTIASFQQEPRAFVGCFDYTEMSNALTATILTEMIAASALGGPTAFVGGAAGTLGLMAQPYIAKDIFLPNEALLNSSRGVVTHEYGHFLMCDIYADESGALVDLYVNRLGNGFDEEIQHNTSIAMEGFADFFASQVASGVNYASLNSTRTTDKMSWCINTACIEENYRGLDLESPPADPYRDQIRRLYTTYHDVFDRPNDSWRSSSGATNVDAWHRPGTYIVPSPAGYLADSDDGVSLPASAVRDWIFNTAGGSTDEHEMLASLTDTMYSHGVTWCDACGLLAAHDPSFSPIGASVRDRWEACLSGDLAELVGPPPVPDLRLDAANCRECPLHAYSDGTGTCFQCADSRAIAIGDSCNVCPDGMIPASDREECVACGPKEISVGTTCVACGFGLGPDRSTNTCEVCPPDAVFDWSTTALSDPLCDSISAQVNPDDAGPSDLCGSEVWLDITNIDPTYRLMIIGFADREVTTAPVEDTCEASGAAYDVGYRHVFAPGGGSAVAVLDRVEEPGVYCSGSSCSSNCNHYFTAFEISDAELSGTTGLRVMFDLDEEFGLTPSLGEPMLTLRAVARCAPQ
jgi:hypothetical protein